MSIIKINHSEASEGGKQLTPGTYQAEVKSASVKQSSTGNPMIELQFAVRKDIEQPHGGSVVYDRLVLTENAMWKVQTYAKALGLPDGLEVDSYEELATIMKGLKAEMEVGEREYNGKTYAQVNRLNPAIDAVDETADVDLEDSDLPF